MNATDQKRLVNNLQAEVDGAALYRALAALESGSALATFYGRMAKAEEFHAELWRSKLGGGGRAQLPDHSAWRARILIALARRFGARLILPSRR